jgi:integrase
MTQDAVSGLFAALRALGVTPEQAAQALAAGPEEPPGAGLGRHGQPTVAEFTAVVEAAAPPGCRRTYATYWHQLVARLGTRPVGEVRTSELLAVAAQAEAGALRRRNSRDGRSARENCVAGMRYFFNLAVQDGLRPDNPALAVPKPRRLPSPRRPLTAPEVEQLWQVTAAGGDDPLLDTLLLRFHLETGARRGGALALRLPDLLVTGQQVRLREKGGTVRLQPVSATLLQALAEHAAARGARAGDEAVFRYRPRRGDTTGAPLTRRRYNTLAARWQAALPWAADYGVSPHWLRHTSIAAVERVAGFGVARAFAGHATPAETTTTYITAAPEEVARAVSWLTGEPHPLAPEEARGREGTSSPG